MMYRRQDCGQDGACWASLRRESYLSSIGAASASAAAASTSAGSEDSQKAQQDSSETSNLNEEGAQISSSIDLESSTTVSVPAVASETTSSTDAFITGSSSTLFSESSSVSISSFSESPSMISQTFEPWGGGGPFHPSPTSTALASTSTDSPANSSPSPDTEAARSSTKKTALIAGVVVPIILILAGGLIFLTCLRRRRRSAQATSATAPGLLEKVSHKRLDSDTTALGPITTIHEDNGAVVPQRLPNPHLMIPSSQNPTQNPTYFTGLDTFSMHSAATTEDPPPPYRTHSILSARSTEPQHFIPLSPISPLSPQAEHESLSPFADTHAVPPAAVTRSPSMRSFASTLYSSDASVYEARPARRSVGNACLVPGSLGPSPFADPEEEAESEGRS